MQKEQKQTTIRLSADDQECIERLKADYGLTSDVQAIRLALRLAQLERFPLPQPQTRMEKK
jgi:hypothetical protein